MKELAASDEFEFLEPAHAELLAALHAASDDSPWNAESFASLLRHRHRFGWLAHEAGAPAGYILVQAIAGEGEILSLAVRPEARRRAIARRLVERAMSEVERRGARRLLLEVAASNLPARTLYDALGFRQIGTRRAYYQRRDGLEDALVMSYVFKLEESGLGAAAGGRGGASKRAPER